MKKKDFPRRCQSCTFFMKIYDGEFICDYNSQKNELRPCPISDECTVYVPKGTGRKKRQKFDPFR